MSMFYDSEKFLLKVSLDHKAIGGYAWLNIKN